MESGVQRHNTITPGWEHCYPIQANLYYRIVYGGRVLEGHGTTLAVSSKKLVFQSERAIPDSVAIELRLDWPIRLDNVVSLRLHVHGKTLRNNGSYATVRILRHEFRTSTRHHVAGHGASLPESELFVPAPDEPLRHTVRQG